MIELAVTPEPVMVWPTANVPVSVPATVRTVPAIVPKVQVASVGSEALSAASMIVAALE